MSAYERRVPSVAPERSFLRSYMGDPYWSPSHAVETTNIPQEKLKKWHDSFSRRLAPDKWSKVLGFDPWEATGTPKPVVPIPQLPSQPGWTTRQKMLAAAGIAVPALVAASYGAYRYMKGKNEPEEKVAIAPFETMDVGTEDNQAPSDDNLVPQSGWKNRLADMVSRFPSYEDSGASGAGGKTQASSGSAGHGFFGGGSSSSLQIDPGLTLSTGDNAEADQPPMQLDSDTASTGQVAHLSA